ncbi:hypothetical protein [Pseudorhodoplanes sinuspersici]|nr:hypothetical protein [Pseudorhodoplanes sinuspersici]
MAFQGPWNVHAQPGAIKGYAKASTGRACLTGQTRAILDRLEARIGAVSIISTCRPGAVIAGTRRPSFHRYGMAVDFKTRRKAEAIAFLRSQGVFVMTYCRMGHVHFNTGQRGASFCGQRGLNASARKRGRRR